MKTEESAKNDEEWQSYKELLLDHRKFLTSCQAEAWKAFDYRILFISTGAIALSISFLDKLVVSLPVYKYLLIVSWLLFAFSLFSSLLSLLSTMYSVNMQTQWIDFVFREQMSPLDEDEPPRTWDNVTTICNWVSLCCLTLGVVGLCLFAYSNLPQTVLEAKKKEMLKEEGLLKEKDEFVEKKQGK